MSERTSVELTAEQLQRLYEADPALYDEIVFEARAQAARRHEQEAHSNLQDTIARYDYDATGQDGEAAIDAAARDYVDAQDARLKAEDPERYAEMRAMGLLR